MSYQTSRNRFGQLLTASVAHSLPRFAELQRNKAMQFLGHTSFTCFWSRLFCWHTVFLWDSWLSQSYSWFRFLWFAPDVCHHKNTRDGCMTVRILCWFTTCAMMLKNSFSRTYLGSLLHLTRQHWISWLFLILPGNDDDGCPRTSGSDTSEELCLSKNTGVNNPHEDDFWHLAPILPGSAGLCICFLTLSGNDVCWVAHLLQGGELFALVHDDWSRTISSTGNWELGTSYSMLIHDN